MRNNFFLIALFIFIVSTVEAELQTHEIKWLTKEINTLVSNIKNSTNRKLLTEMVNDAPVKRYFKDEVFYCDTLTMEWMITNLPISTKILENIGIAPIEITELSNGIYQGIDRHGTLGWFITAAEKPLSRLYKGWGGYHGKFNVEGKVVLYMTYKELRGAYGRPKLIYSLAIYVKLDSGILNFFARVLSPFIKKTIDNSLLWVMQVARRTSLLIYSNYYTIYNRMLKDKRFTTEDIKKFVRYCKRRDKASGRKRKYIY